MSSLAERARPGATVPPAGSRPTDAGGPLPASSWGASTLIDVAFSLAVAVALAAIAFAADGGQRLERTTWVEVALILGGAGLTALALLLGAWRAEPGRPSAAFGAWTLAALAALAALTALSIVWSLHPADSWLEANRTFAYLYTFAGGLALVRLAPGRWSPLLVGVALACLAVCGWALLTKVFPASLAPDETFARLREPFGYWNAVGLMAASGVPPLLWIGARRWPAAAVSALAYPLIGLLLVCVMLSYSRGALLALVVGLGFWFAFVPLRLRGLVVLGVSTLGAGAVVGWAFSQNALTADDLLLPVRTDAGHELGVLLMLMLVVLLAAGLIIGLLSATRPPSARLKREVGTALVVFVAGLPVAGLVGLALAPGGIDGQASKTWNQLTDESAATPANTPGRLTATSSVRARYWREGVKVYADHPALGAGAGAYATARTRYRTGKLDVRHAHGYLVQTLADLGLVGLFLSLAGLAAWIIAAVQATGLRRSDRGLPFDAERIGLLTLVSIVVVFGVHSLVDWTWFIPANAVLALLCAGWVAGRGPLRTRLAPVPSPAAGGPTEAPGPAPVGNPDAPAGPASPTGDAPETSPRRRRLPAGWRTPAGVPAGAIGGAAAVLLAAGATAWAVVQPLRSVHAGDAALERVEIGAYPQAAEIARIGAQRNPLSVEPLWELASIEDLRGNTAGAQAALEEAVELQPANAEAWRRLGRYQLLAANQPRVALETLRAADYLDPRNPASAADLLAAQRAAAAASP